MAACVSSSTATMSATPSDAVYEIEDPGAGYSPTTCGAARHAGDSMGRHLPRQAAELGRATARRSPCSTSIPEGLYWNESTQLLYWTYYDAYNVTRRPDWGLGATRLDNPGTGASTAFGPWRTTARTVTAPPTTARGGACYLFAIRWTGR